MDVREKLVELKKCPFCGEEAFLNEYKYELDSCHVLTNFVECNGCHTTTFEYGSKKEAIKSWNRRVCND